MKYPLVALVSIAALGIGGCGVLNNADSDKSAEPAATAQATPATAKPTEDTGATGSVKDQGDIPNPCTLLSKAEVTSLTGRTITQIDEDGADDGDVTRFCQWQQNDGQLAVFLSRTTEAEFKVTTADATRVDGVGEDAYSASGHLYVLYGTVQIDVYSRGDAEEQNIVTATKVAKVIIPKI
ncbi:DUF3558 family protein [Actinoplanes sp. L3-i22]|uniref:DUF3558 family protein n=1 Tax=Actinoplanes sp. L3-i22 TaxID=2836373 RepID=UPI001C76AB96|nr:DUF3558 family protein [Actinoplanes sp. L3-i22]BCY08331.1 hypothetical protein L3i22_034190 [Actinoplanes sp. L3-i22]